MLPACNRMINFLINSKFLAKKGNLCMSVQICTLDLFILSVQICTFEKWSVQICIRQDNWVSKIVQICTVS